MERSWLDCLPEDILLSVFAYCDVQSLLRLSLTCRRFYVCLDKESFWKKKLHMLFSQLNAVPKSIPLMGYKSACLRFSAVFSDLDCGLWTEYLRCEEVFSSASAIQDRDEVIIFDFGSKTTWFKYASESTGQLSMHPTVAPTPWKPNSDIAEGTCEVLDIYQSCAVCSRMFRNRTLSVGSLENNDKPEEMKVECTSSRKLTSAFSRLAMKHFPSCFDSGDLTEDMLSMVTDLQQPSLMSGSAVTNPSEVTSLRPTLSMDKPVQDHVLNANLSSRNVLPAGSLPKRGLSSKKSPSQPTSGDNTPLVSDTIKMYKFLMTHMLKRNPFFQARCIPFVLCEPTNCSVDMKVQLLQFLIAEMKVPGVCYIPKPVATALYSGLDTCLVIDSGANNTVVSAVVDQTVLDYCVQKKPIGGTFLTRRLHECILLKGVDFEVDECHLDSSQVKRECHVAYSLESENRKSRNPNTIHIKGNKNGVQGYHSVCLGPELYLACEDLYLNLDLPSMVQQAIQPLDTATCRRLLTNIVLTGGNCRLTGLALRLTKDLKQLLPEYQAVVRVVDPRLMTGRTDAVIGASYIRKWFDAFWITRQDYILHGAVDCLEMSLSNQVHCV